MKSWKVVVTVVAVLTVIYAFTLILPLLNRNDDASNVWGVFLILALCVTCANLMPWTWRWMQRGVVLVVILGFLGASTSGCTRVGPGHVGIKVSNAGDNRGVNQLPLSTGWVFYMPGASSVFEYPTFVQTVVWTRDTHEGGPTDDAVTFNTMDNMVVGADISLSYQLIDRAVPAFYVKFRSDDLTAFTNGFLRNVVRTAFGDMAGTFTAEEINSTKRSAFQQAVRDRINKQTEVYGVHIEQMGIIGKLHFPDNIQAAINGKVAATQQAEQAENELRVSRAQAAKRVASAEGEARANQVLTSSITPMLLEWKRLEILQSRWDGKYPLYLSGGSIPPIIALPGSVGR